MYSDQLMYTSYNYRKLYARLVCGRSSVSTLIKSNQRLLIGICCFSAKQAALKRKIKDWLARTHDNVLEWGDMSIRGLLFQ